MKRAAIRHRGNPKVGRQAIVHIQIPDKHLTAEPSKRCRDMRGICRLRYPSFLITNGDNPCAVLRVVHATLSHSMNHFFFYLGTKVLIYQDTSILTRFEDMCISHCLSLRSLTVI